MFKMDINRFRARRMLAISEKCLSGIIFDCVANDECFGRIRSMGDEALFGRSPTAEMKAKPGSPKGHALTDFLPLITIKANDLASSLANFNILRYNHLTEEEINPEHELNNNGVRRLWIDRNIHPEDLHPAGDIEKTA
jgi:DNA-damage-inducible protein D